MTTGSLTANYLFGADRQTLPQQNMTWADGRIATITPAAKPTEETGRTLIMPAFANAHDHARPLPMSSFGAAFKPLETWLPRTIFATPPDAYLAAALPLARAARAGCASVMVHYTRPSGLLSSVEEARAVAKAAADVGVRLAFAPAIRDMHPLAYGDETAVLDKLSPEVATLARELFCKPVLSVERLIETTEEIAAAIEAPMVSVQFGPAGVQWCSRALLEAIAERSAETGRQVHMHLLETPAQRRWADLNFPQGILTYLKEIGLLSPRLTLAHCVHARPHELDMIAEAGTRFVTNSSSNMHLRSGRAPIRDAWRRGCAIALGMDGQALDDDDDMLRETRLTEGLNGGLGFDPTWTRAEFLGTAIAHGRAATGADGTGTLVPGGAADFVVVNYDRLDRDRLMDLDPIDLLFARGTSSHIDAVVVAGKTIVRDGKVLGLDVVAAEDELRKLYRSSIRRFDGLERHWTELEAALFNWFAEFQGCC
jgi:cytosine/adenosine deaminase-related metal-dependent hydrolase